MTSKRRRRARKRQWKCVTFYMPADHPSPSSLLIRFRFVNNDPQRTTLGRRSFYNIHTALCRGEKNNTTLPIHSASYNNNRHGRPPSLSRLWLLFSFFFVINKRGKSADQNRAGLACPAAPLKNIGKGPVTCEVLPTRGESRLPPSQTNVAWILTP